MFFKLVTEKQYRNQYFTVYLQTNMNNFAVVLKKVF